MAGFRLHPGNDGVLYLAGELDMASADGFVADALARMDGQRDVVLNLSDLQFVDSTGIRAFLKIAKAVEPRPVVLRDPHPNVHHVLDVVRIETFGVRVERPAE